MKRIWASASFNRFHCSAWQGSNRPIQQFNHFEHQHVRWATSQHVPAADPAFTSQQPVVPQREQDLLQEFHGDISTLREILDLMNFLVRISGH
jgi:hypothetical protein